MKLHEYELWCKLTTEEVKGILELLNTLSYESL